MSSIVIFKRGERLEGRPLKDVVTIGRTPDNVIQLEADLVSRRHAAVVKQNGEVWVEDLRSTNGTFVNGSKVEPGQRVKVGHGDRIRLGREGVYELVLDLGERKEMLREPAEPPAAPPRAEALLPRRSPLMEHLLSERGRIPVWSGGVTEVIVADIIEETPDTKTYRFVGAEAMIFSYKPGQFVTLQLEIDGSEIKRSYSMSSTPSRPHALEITVKRVPGGLVSNWLADNLKLGDRVKLRGPSGKFTCFEYPSNKMLFVGAGSGITPLMSMSRWIIDTTADVDVKFLVSARTPVDVIFRRELEFLAARHSGFKAVITITSGWGGHESWVGLTGRVSAPLIELVCPDVRERHVFTCGPEPFMDALEECLESIRFDMKQFHKESFGARRVAQGTQVPSRDALPRKTLEVPLGPVGPVSPEHSIVDAVPVVPEGEFEIVFAKSGKTVCTAGDTSLLEVAEANGIEIDYACRNGACGACKVVCQPPGAVEMDNDTGLDAADRGRGLILACVARPRAALRLDA